MPSLHLVLDDVYLLQDPAEHGKFLIQSISRYFAPEWNRTPLIAHAGKRYNVLRRRLDSWNYDIDQLILGAMLFTLISFLFPTVVSYHALLCLVSNLFVETSL